MGKAILGELSARQIVRYISFSLLSVLMFFQNCGEVEFSESLPSNITVVALGNGQRLATENFSSLATVRPVDMVWVIDNSGSMGQEAAHVRSNLNSFMDSIGSLDVKVAIVSAEGDILTRVNLSEAHKANGHRLIDHAVYSHDSLEILNGLLCETVEASSPSECDHREVRREYEGPGLRGFFREQAKKVFVFVTDDNSHVPGGDFEQVFSAVMQTEFALEQTPMVHAFIGHGSGVSPCQAQTGSVYMGLVGSSGGQSYNICEADWSQHFSSLSESVFGISTNRFRLTYQNVTEVRSVKINGTEISSSLYHLDDGHVAISEAAFNGASSGALSVVVEYVFGRADE